MAQNLIKINYEGEKCAGLYLVDEDFGGKEITKLVAPQGRGTYKLVLRQTISILGKGKITAKETFVKQGTTFLKAIQSVIAEREAMKQRIIDKTTGATQKREEDAKVEFLMLDELWELFYEHKTSYKAEIGRQKRWAEKLSVNGKPIGGTAYIMTCNYNSLIKPTLGKMRVIDIKKKHVEDLMKHVLNKRGLKMRAAKSIIDILKPMFEWHFDREEIDKRNPASIKLGALNNERNVVVEFEDMQKLYKTMLTYKEVKYRNVFTFLASGRRIGEVLSLHTDNIKGSYFTVTAENNKAGVDMIYKMSKVMKKAVPKSGYIHTGVRDHSKALSRESVARHWHNIKRDSGLFDLRIHDLRHIINTLLEDSAVPLEIRAGVLGHKGGSIITNRYSTDNKRRADLKAKAVDFFLDKVFGRISIDKLWHEL